MPGHAGPRGTGREALPLAYTAHIATGQPANTSVGEHRVVFTDAIIYKSLAAEIGTFPSSVITAIVDFYTAAVDIARISNMSESLRVRCRIEPSIPP